MLREEGQLSAAKANPVIILREISPAAPLCRWLPVALTVTRKSVLEKGAAINSDRAKWTSNTSMRVLLHQR